MNFSLGKFRTSFRPEVLFFILLLGIILGSTLLCSCADVTFEEGFQTISSALGVGPEKAAAAGQQPKKKEAFTAPPPAKSQRPLLDKLKNALGISSSSSSSSSSPSSSVLPAVSDKHMGAMSEAFTPGSANSASGDAAPLQGGGSKGGSTAAATSVPVSNPQAFEKKTKGAGAGAGAAAGKETFTTASAQSSLTGGNTDGYANANADYVYSNPSTWTQPTPMPVRYGNGNMPKPLPPGELDFLATTQYNPSCCPSIYSNSSGCACLSDQQLNFLATRGGNNIPYSEV